VGGGCAATEYATAATADTYAQNAYTRPPFRISAHDRAVYAVWLERLEHFLSNAVQLTLPFCLRKIIHCCQRKRTPLKTALRLRRRSSDRAVASAGSLSLSSTPKTQTTSHEVGSGADKDVVGSGADKDEVGSGADKEQKEKTTPTTTSITLTKLVMHGL
jgi:hypothetical protein